MLYDNMRIDITKIGNRIGVDATINLINGGTDYRKICDISHKSFKLEYKIEERDSNREDDYFTYDTVQKILSSPRFIECFLEVIRSKATRDGKSYGTASFTYKNYGNDIHGTQELLNDLIKDAVKYNK